MERNGQMSFFDLMYDEYHFKSNISLIELFAGYGSQALSLKYLQEDGLLKQGFRHLKISEWAIPSILAYYDLHKGEKGIKENIECNLTVEQLNEYLLNKGISKDYNKPASEKEIKKLSFKKKKDLYIAIESTNNLVNVMSIKGKDLEIPNQENETTILTYSFPCQDLSNAGKRKGMSVSQADGGTRSGLLWEVERILTELYESKSNMPSVLLMENVPQIHSQQDKPFFLKWISRLEELGYSNYWEDLSATDYEIPQTRVRTFMVSIKGEYTYSFPKRLPLKKCLYDMLERNADAKYFLKEERIKAIVNWNSQQNPLEKVGGKKTIAPTIVTRQESETSSMILVSDKFEDTTNVRKEIIKLGNYSKSNHNATNILSPLGSAQTVMECHGSIQAVAIPIKNATKKGYLLAEEEEEDGIDISTRMESHRGTVQKGLAQTLKTQCEVGVIQKKPINESDLIGGFGEKGSTNQYRTQNRIYSSSSSPTLSTAFNPYFLEDYGIRKLTPRECFRLMGLRDYDIDKLTRFTDQQKWHLAGDSIVVNVLYYVFKQMI